ncbi:MAG: TIGR01906 family membrane protein [Clostridia bacterium]
MKRFFSRLLAFCASLIIIFALLLSALQFVINDEGWFDREYKKLQLSEQIGIPTEDITAAMMQLVHYMEDEAGSIDIDVNENGRLVSMYNDRERAHMVDVKALYQSFRDMRAYGLIGAAAVLLFIAMLMRRDTLRTLGEGFTAATWVFIFILVGLGAWMLIDFNSFWTQFHYAFFTNDLWMLDPATCRMIRICPERLFFDIIVRFAILFLVPMAILYAFSRIFVRHGRKREGNV